MKKNKKDKTNSKIGYIDKLMIEESVRSLYGEKKPTSYNIKSKIADISYHQFTNAKGPNPFIISTFIYTKGEESALSRAALRVINEDEVTYSSANRLNQEPDMISDCTEWSPEYKNATTHEAFTLTARFYNKDVLIKELKLLEEEIQKNQQIYTVQNNNKHIGHIDRLMLRRFVASTSGSLSLSAIQEEITNVNYHQFTNAHGHNPYTRVMIIHAKENSELSRAAFHMMQAQKTYQSSNPLNKTKDYNSISYYNRTKYDINPTLLNTRNGMISECTKLSPKDKNLKPEKPFTLTARFYNQEALINELNLLEQEARKSI